MMKFHSSALGQHYSIASSLMLTFGNAERAITLLTC